MNERKDKKQKPKIFPSIRKPTAPAGQKFGPEKRVDKLDPVLRKSKHKKKQQTDADI